MRLKIIDLAGGDQPMVSDDGDTVIAFNGEIYNHAELRRELEGRGPPLPLASATPRSCCTPFSSGTRTASARLRGMFAVRSGSSRERRLVLARDRMGIKPLYFHRRGDDLYFGSELKAILEHPEIERAARPGRPGLLSLAQLRALPAHAGRGHREAAAGPLAGMARRRGAQRAPTGSLRVRAARSGTLDDAKEELDRLLRDSVREHLISDVPLGVWASGGVDSSTILHYAAAGIAGAPEDLLGLLPRPQLRRKPVLPRGRARITAPTTTSST